MIVEPWPRVLVEDPPEGYSQLQQDVAILKSQMRIENHAGKVQGILSRMCHGWNPQQSCFLEKKGEFGGWWGAVMV